MGIEYRRKIGSHLLVEQNGDRLQITVPGRLTCTFGVFFALALFLFALAIISWHSTEYSTAIGFLVVAIGFVILPLPRHERIVFDKNDIRAKGQQSMPWLTRSVPTSAIKRFVLKPLYPYHLVHSPTIMLDVFPFGETYGLFAEREMPSQDEEVTIPFPRSFCSKVATSFRITWQAAFHPLDHLTRTKRELLLGAQASIHEREELQRILSQHLSRLRGNTNQSGSINHGA